jgi:predicted nucleotidyltransferase
VTWSHRLSKSSVQQAGSAQARTAIVQSEFSDATDVARLRAIFSNDERVIDAYLYGSSLRSDHVPGASDIDLLVIVADSSTTADFVEVAATTHQAIPAADVTLVTERELELAIHPSGSRHFFVSVAQTGVHLCGPNRLLGVAARPLSFDETYRNAVQLCQRLRLVFVNPGKRQEREFWLSKCQHWIPCLLMELLHLHGTPERRLRVAQRAFFEQFLVDWADVSYPYGELADVHHFMDRLVRWLPENADRFVVGLRSRRADVPATWHGE